MLTKTIDTQTNPLRDSITNAYRMDENECVAALLTQITFSPAERTQIDKTARQLVTETRAYKKRQSKIDALLHQYDLSTDEGISLMCLAEALLRIPDNATMDKFISDKLSTVEWQNHIKRDQSFFINAATWSLVLTGKIYGPQLDTQKNWFNALKRAISRVGTAMVRPVILQMMKAIGKQFVMGQSIDEALKRAQELEQKGYRFSYDMLGEAARTEADAKRYYQSYIDAIHAIGKAAHDQEPAKNPGISVKLSALHPRFEFMQRERVMNELPPLLLSLAQLAKQYRIGLTIDAEEADRLDLTLDVFEKVFRDPTLNDWQGFGIVVQAYQKRASYVIDWLIALSNETKKRIMLRLVKGAYWDAEIKTSQLLGLDDYPVFTRKACTDVSYLACAKKLLTHPNNFYPQFGTHNAYSVAAILQMTQGRDDFEFQCLHGMGRALYDQVVDSQGFNTPTRIYAPVGTHKDLLGYLVRRLLENGANSSFINKLSNENISIDTIIEDPVLRVAALKDKRHPKIPKPRDIYGQWKNSSGVDLSNTAVMEELKKTLDELQNTTWEAGPIINGKLFTDKNAEKILSPANTNDVVGYATEANDDMITSALEIAEKAQNDWSMQTVSTRASILERAADLFEENFPTFLALLTREAGRTIPDCISEVREAIDFCRYYAYQAREVMPAKLLPGPTGEENYLSLHGRGVFVCISPWNFPLAIFTGQIVAALVAGNTVIAKPAEQTPLIATFAVKILHEAGVPTSVLQLAIGRGDVGAKLTKDERIAGVMFTGSTETAKLIGKTLANRVGPIPVFVAETGGQNVMIVDSSALPEQAIVDVAQSAFNSAGQRCSALRALFIQDEIADHFITMLKGYLAELRIGNPALLSTDIGPVIDTDALEMLRAHATKMKETNRFIVEANIPNITGHYFSPCAFELNTLSTLQKEVFGPILHIIRYKARDLDKVMDAVIATNYGLTLGVHSRIEQTIEYILSRMPVGNTYVNRNIIGAVVGVQPFGGERLSGTGPKAGGPHYLPHLCVERTTSINTTAVGGNARLISLLEED